jgi:hypothetical protein
LYASIATISRSESPKLIFKAGFYLSTLLFREWDQYLKIVTIAERRLRAVGRIYGEWRVLELAADDREVIIGKGARYTMTKSWVSACRAAHAG